MIKPKIQNILKISSGPLIANIIHTSKFFVFLIISSSIMKKLKFDFTETQLSVNFRAFFSIYSRVF